jgi:hypothetical protein
VGILIVSQARVLTEVVPQHRIELADQAIAKVESQTFEAENRGSHRFFRYVIQVIRYGKHGDGKCREE